MFMQPHKFRGCRTKGFLSFSGLYESVRVHPHSAYMLPYAHLAFPEQYLPEHSSLVPAGNAFALTALCSAFAFDFKPRRLQFRPGAAFVSSDQAKGGGPQTQQGAPGRLQGNAGVRELE
eukprot:scaffold162185_cov15-Tisochrysis_lutea.AAC.2